MRTIRWLLLAAVLAVTLSAQTYSSTRAVHGTVNDGGGEPLRGAVVYLENTQTLQIRSYITKRDGSYAFHRLSTDVDYTLQARYRGKCSPTKRLSKFNSRPNPVVDLKINL